MESYFDNMGCCAIQLGILDNVTLNLEETEEPDINDLRLYIFDSGKEGTEKMDVLFRDVSIRGLEYSGNGDDQHCYIWFDSNTNYPFEVNGETAHLNTISSKKINRFVIDQGILEPV